jgi:ribosome-associated heat shock protein Hsp15
MLEPLAETRVDRWMWAVRLYATRSQAIDACRAGHVEVNGRPAKPASAVHVGDRVVTRRGGIERDLEVLRIIERRVGAPVAAECVVDHSPPPPPKEFRPAPLFMRDPASGRPTKRDRRQLDRFRRS